MYAFLHDEEEVAGTVDVEESDLGFFVLGLLVLLVGLLVLSPFSVRILFLRRASSNLIRWRLVGCFTTVRDA